VKDLEAGNEESAPLPETATTKERMAYKLKIRRGRSTYRKRKETAESVFRVMKNVMGFRQFLLRSPGKVNIEWELVKTAYDSGKPRRLFYGTGVSCRPV